MYKKQQHLNTKVVKVFLNNMNSWFSNFIIEQFRTDHNPDSKMKYEFTGTISTTSTTHTMRPLPKYLQPKIMKVEYNPSYKSSVFQNDLFIYDLNTGNFNEIDYIIKGIKSQRFETDKTVLIISNIMTWAKTPTKYKQTEDEQGECYEPPIDDNEEVDNIITEHVNENEQNTKQYQHQNSINDNLSRINTNNDISKINKTNTSRVYSQKSDFRSKSKDHHKDKDWFEEKTIDDTNQLNNAIMYYHETDYTQRIPGERYIQFKYIENQVLSLSNKPNVKAYVICPGFIYGCGEDFFYDLYRCCYLFDSDTNAANPLIRSLLHANNTLPTIHIKDLITLIKRIIDRKPQIKYILAVDQTKNNQVRNIVKSIQSCFSKEKQQQPSNEEAQQQQLEENKDIHYEPIHNYNDMFLNLKVKSSSLFFDSKKEGEDKEDYDKRSFKWHCQYGIPENISTLRKEFIKYRGLKPNKIFILGTPYTGKTTLSHYISEYFNLPSLSLGELIQQVKDNSTNETLLNEIKATIAEMEASLKEAEENYNKRSNKKKGDPPFNAQQYMKFDTCLLTKIVQERLTMGNACIDGFVLDGYPRTHNEAEELFNGSEITLNTSLIVVFDAVEDEFVINRIKQSESYCKEYTKEPNPIMDRAYRRLANVKGVDKDETLLKFFEKNNANMLRLNCKESVDEVVNKCKLFVLNNNEGKRNINYERLGYIEEGGMCEEEENEEVNVNEEKVESERNVKEDEGCKDVKNVVKKSKLEIEKERKFKLLERKTEVLRRYLSDNVLPMLSKGIIHVCETRPNDPVEALANYLLEYKFHTPKVDDNKQQNNDVNA